MKRTLKTVACLLMITGFLMMTGIVASAENGFVFNIKGFNQTITGEDATIVTTNDAYQNCNPKWAISVVCSIYSDNILKVAKDPVAGQGEVPSDVKLKDGQVVLVVHSSTSDPANADQYPNVYGKLAALELQKGQFLVLEGLDLTNATGAGTATVVEKEKNLPKTDTSTEPEPESSEPEPESSEPEPESQAEPEPESQAEPEPESQAEPEPESQAEPEPVSEAEPASEAQPQESAPAASEPAPSASSGGFPSWAWIPIIAGCVAVVAIILAIVLKKKK